VDNRQVHGEAQSQLEALIALEDAHNANKTAQDAEMEQLLHSVTSNKAEICLQLNQTNAMHAELRSSHEKLVNSHKQLLSAHNSLSTSHSVVRQNCETQHADFNSSMELERNARTSTLAAMEDAHRAEVGRLHNNIKSLEVLIREDRARTVIMC